MSMKTGTHFPFFFAWKYEKHSDNHQGRKEKVREMVENEKTCYAIFFTLIACIFW